MSFALWQKASFKSPVLRMLYVWTKLGSIENLSKNHFRKENLSAVSVGRKILRTVCGADMLTYQLKDEQKSIHPRGVIFGVANNLPIFLLRIALQIDVYTFERNTFPKLIGRIVLSNKTNTFEKHHYLHFLKHTLKKIPLNGNTSL